MDSISYLGLIQNKIKYYYLLLCYKCIKLVSTCYNFINIYVLPTHN